MKILCQILATGYCIAGSALLMKGLFVTTPYMMDSWVAFGAFHLAALFWLKLADVFSYSEDP